jgi:hypothetical protein
MEAISLSKRTFYRADGRTLPIVRFYDAEGGDCESQDAVALLVGEGDEWAYIDLSEWEETGDKH